MVSVTCNRHWCAIYLASQSPRRQELLTQLGIDHQILAVDVDETWIPDESATEYVQRLARTKAEAGLAAIGRRPPRPVLGADTAVVLDGEVLGKAECAITATNMLLRLSARCHQVLTAVSLGRRNGMFDTRLSVSHVYMRPLAQAEIDSYCLGGEPIGKAGGYAIQGFAAAFIERIEGSYSGVMGLPLYETASLLSRCD